MRPMYLCALVGCAVSLSVLPESCLAQPKLVYNWGGSGPGASGNTVALAASPGFEFTVGINVNNQLISWGSNFYGQRSFVYVDPLDPGCHYPPAIGEPCYPSSSECYLHPERCVPAPRNMPPLTQISASWDHVLAYSPGYVDPLSSYDTHGLLAWGHNELGRNDYCKIPNLWDDPQNTGAGYWRIDPTTKVKTISAGEYINVVLFDNGQVACWGDNSYGVDPRSARCSTPEFQPYHQDYNLRFKEAIAGGHFVALLTTGGDIITWGAFVYTVNCPGGGGIYGPGYRGTDSLASNNPWRINNPGNPPVNLPLVYHPPYRGLAATHHTIMALRDWTAANPDDTGLMDMWGADAGAVRSTQPTPEKYHWAQVVGGSYLPWCVGNPMMGTTLIGWGDGNPFEIPGQPPPPDMGAFDLAPGNSNRQLIALCYNPNCDGSTTPPVLTANDFMCFQNTYAAAQSLSYEGQLKSYANCDGSTTAPVLTANDFMCFTAKYAAGGCP